MYPDHVRGGTDFTRTEIIVATSAMVLALVLVPFALAGFSLAVYFLLILAGTAALTALADATARLTKSRTAVIFLCVVCALAALASLLAFPTFEIVGGEVRRAAWSNLVWGVAFGPAVAAAVANSRLESPPRRRRRSSPPGAPH